ncbi:2'-5' RNA ligase family protein [Streptomyces sp. TRM70308]|uniref:2'-5' RNA ligase family protein n=1 Tax=Streptomyces sp. TRM70308 TaxID=3131932 RepID=UPI003D07E51D
MRLFTALLPPHDVVDALTAEVAALRALPGGDRLRWTDPAGWHVTLAFYGEVADDASAELRTRLARTAGRGHPLALRLRGGGRFGDRALWAGIEGAAAEGAGREPGRDAARSDLAHLAAAARAAGRRVGAGPSDDGPYTPHLTLARAKAGPGLAPFARALADFASPPWHADTLALVRSHLPRSGVPGTSPRYETVSTWPLGR